MSKFIFIFYFFCGYFSFFFAEFKKKLYLCTAKRIKYSYYDQETHNHQSRHIGDGNMLL